MSVAMESLYILRHCVCCATKYAAYDYVGAVVRNGGIR